jgi:hypothetical protein
MSRDFFVQMIKKLLVYIRNYLYKANYVLYCINE